VFLGVNTMSNCATCGDVGPYAETHALIAALNGDDEHLSEVLESSSKFELGTFADALDTVSDAIGARLGVMGP
jgi:hypothetical protein